MFSDYASVSSSGNGSNVSRSSSVVGDADAGLVGALGPHPDGVGGGSGSGAESDDSLPPLPEPAATQTSLPDIARSSPVAAAAASGRIQSGTRELTGSLQRCAALVPALLLTTFVRCVLAIVSRQFQVHLFGGCGFTGSRMGARAESGCCELCPEGLL